jgi:hypothetical protein
MSISGVQKLLWELARDPGMLAAYRADSAAFISRYNIDAAERAQILAMDVRSLADSGVEPMILMQGWNAIVGPDSIADYLGRLNGPALTPLRCDHG